MKAFLSLLLIPVAIYAVDPPASADSQKPQSQSQVSENPPFVVAEPEPRSYGYGYGYPGYYNNGYGYYRPGYGYGYPGNYYGYGKRSVYVNRPSGGRPGRDADPASAEGAGSQSQSQVSANPPFLIDDTIVQPELRIYDPYYRCRFPRACPRILTKRDAGESAATGSADSQKSQFRSKVSENPPFVVADDGVQEPEPRSYGYGYPGYYNGGYGYYRPGYGYGYPGNYYGYGKRSVYAVRPSGGRPGRDADPSKQPAADKSAQIPDRQVDPIRKPFPQLPGNVSPPETDKPQFQSQVSANPPFVVVDGDVQEPEPRSYGYGYSRPGYYRPGYGYYRPGGYYGYGKRSVYVNRPSGGQPSGGRPGRDVQTASGAANSEKPQFQSKVSENPPFVSAGEPAEPRSLYYRPGYGYPGVGYYRPGYGLYGNYYG